MIALHTDKYTVLKFRIHGSFMINNTGATLMRDHPIEGKRGCTLYLYMLSTNEGGAPDGHASPFVDRHGQGQRKGACVARTLGGGHDPQ